MKNPQAMALALAHPTKPWARRYLRRNSSMFLPPSPKAIERREARKRFVKGALTADTEVKHD